MSEPTKLTPEQIAAIRERLEAATPGPWGREGDPVTCNEVSDVRGIKLYGKYKAVRCRDDADFIAAAPTDIAALLAHVAALDAELAAARAENARMRTVANNMAGADWTVLPSRPPHDMPEAAEQMAADGWRFRGYDINRNFLLVRNEMGHGIYKQPNGLYAIWSSIVDNFVLLDATPDDIVRAYVEAYEQEAREMVTRRIAQIESGGGETWADKVEWVGVVHGPDGLRELATYTEGWWSPTDEQLAEAQRNQDEIEFEDESDA